MTDRYSLEIDNGICIYFSDYPFNEKGLERAKDIANSFLKLNKKRHIVKIYNPQNQTVFENEF